MISYRNKSDSRLKGVRATSGYWERLYVRNTPFDLSEVIDLQKMCVDKLMDGTVDNLMDNSSSCPQVDTQAAHELIHDGFIEQQQQDIFISYFQEKLSRQRGPLQG